MLPRTRDLRLPTSARRSIEPCRCERPTGTLVFYGALMDALSRLDRGINLKQKALERDPASGFVLVQIATSFWNQRRYHDTIEWANKARGRARALDGP